MEPAHQTMLARLAIAISVFALVAVVFVGVRAGNSSGSEDTAASVAPVPVALSEFTISPATITVPLGGSLAVTNNGTVTHNLAVTGTALKIKDLNGGETANLDVSSLEPGDYEVFCAIPGHKDSGMSAKLVVTDGSAGAAQDAAAAADASSGGDHASHSAADIGGLEATDAAAKRINKEMEDSMSAGVQSFLDYATKYSEGKVKSGNQKIEPTIESDGTKHFYLTAAITDWEVSPGKVVKAWTYNDQVPGPWLRVEPGDKVKVTLRNELPISTDIHWHGISVPNDQDGVAPITQDYIRPLTDYTYSWTAPDHNELAMYHAHMHGQVAIVNGLFGIVQVGDVPLPKGRTFDGLTVPENIKVAQEIPMVLNDAGVIGLTLNGKGFPETAPIAAKKGDWLLIHFYNEGLQGHPMHLHRQPQLVIAKDGFALDSPYRADTIWVAPGERYSVLVKADEVGTWAFHCHIVSHAENDQGLTGMVTALIVQ